MAHSPAREWAGWVPGGFAAITPRGLVKAVKGELEFFDAQKQSLPILLRFLAGKWLKMTMMNKQQSDNITSHIC